MGWKGFEQRAWCEQRHRVLQGIVCGVGCKGGCGQDRWEEAGLKARVWALVRPVGAAPPGEGALFHYPQIRPLVTLFYMLGSMSKSVCKTDPMAKVLL